MYNNILQWLKQFNNKLKLPTQTNKLDHAPLSASHRSLIPETRGCVTIARGVTITFPLFNTLDPARIELRKKNMDDRNIGVPQQRYVTFR